MDTIVIYTLKKVFNISAMVCLFILLTACPGEDDCFDMGSTTRVNDLIKLLPVQTEYNQGDIVTLSLEIPTSNSYFGNELNIFQEIGDSSALLVLGFNQLFIDNPLNFIKGSEGDSESNNWYNVVYNENNGMYELEIEITLNRAGQYSFVTDDSAVFDGGECNRFRLDTNVLWLDDDIIEFTVN